MIRDFCLLVLLPLLPSLVSTCAPERCHKSSFWAPSKRSRGHKLKTSIVVLLQAEVELCCSWPQAVPHAELKHPRSPMAVGRSPPVAVAKAANLSQQRFGHYRKCLGSRYQSPNLTLQSMTSKGESNPPSVRIIHRFLNL